MRQEMTRSPREMLVVLHRETFVVSKGSKVLGKLKTSKFPSGYSGFCQKYEKSESMTNLVLPVKLHFFYYYLFL